jgi:DNA adenine methylase
MSAVPSPTIPNDEVGISSPTPVRPFLKWAGGKRQLLPRLREFYPRTFATYREPFLGSGAVFFDLVNQGDLDGRNAALTDSNADLIGCYSRLTAEPERVIELLVKLAARYKRDSEAHFYRVRDRQFNPGRRAILLNGKVQSDRYTAELAAMLIYLNRTGYNGLFRLNSKGMFNVPLGRYSNPMICDADNLRSVAEVLARLSVSTHETGYECALGDAVAGDFIYLDPPYAPLSATALFTSYTSTGFTSGDQIRLQKTVLGLARRGCWVLLSNSTAPEVTALYDDNKDARDAGLIAHQVPARRTINSDAGKRGQVLEYIITNIPQRNR